MHRHREFRSSSQDSTKDRQKPFDNEEPLIVKIAIAGPGRSGTTFLVQFLKELGFTVPPGEIDRHSLAGLESRIGGGSPYEVDKDPWCFEYIDTIPIEVLQSYDSFIVPIRNVDDAVLSRSVQERFVRAINFSGDQWKRNTSGSVSGGAISDTSHEGIRRVLQAGLWKLLDFLAQAGVQPKLLHYPTLAESFDYLWGQIGCVVSCKADFETAQRSFRNVVDIQKVRFTHCEVVPAKSISLKELEGLVDLLREELRNRKIQQAEQDESQAKIRMMESSWSWRLTAPLRRAGSVFQMTLKRSERPLTPERGLAPILA